MNLFQAANAWDAEETFLARNEVEALSCKNGKDSLADGQEVKTKILTNARTIGSCHIWSPGHHRDSQLPRELPQQGQVQLEDQGARQRGGAHLVRDLWPSQGRFLQREHQQLWFYLQFKIFDFISRGWRTRFSEHLRMDMERRSLPPKRRGGWGSSSGQTGRKTQVASDARSVFSVEYSRSDFSISFADCCCCSRDRHWFWVRSNTKLKSLGKQTISENFIEISWNKKS